MRLSPVLNIQNLWTVYFAYVHTFFQLWHTILGHYSKLNIEILRISDWSQAKSKAIPVTGLGGL
jgi:hypothetical protein